MSHSVFRQQKIQRRRQLIQVSAAARRVFVCSIVCRSAIECAPASRITPSLGSAGKRAARILAHRLRPSAEKVPNGQGAGAVSARFSRASLASPQSFFSTCSTATARRPPTAAGYCTRRSVRSPLHRKMQPNLPLHRKMQLNRPIPTLASPALRVEPVTLVLLFSQYANERRRRLQVLARAFRTNQNAAVSRHNSFAGARRRFSGGGADRT